LGNLKNFSLDCLTQWELGEWLPCLVHGFPASREKWEIWLHEEKAFLSMFAGFIALRTSISSLFHLCLSFFVLLPDVFGHHHSKWNIWNLMFTIPDFSRVYTHVTHFCFKIGNWNVFFHQVSLYGIGITFRFLKFLCTSSTLLESCLERSCHDNRYPLLLHIRCLNLSTPCLYSGRGTSSRLCQSLRCHSADILTRVQVPYVMDFSFHCPFSPFLLLRSLLESPWPPSHHCHSNWGGYRCMSHETCPSDTLGCTYCSSL
jgi:hypothetical protein